MIDLIKGFILNDFKKVATKLTIEDYNFLFKTKLGGYVYDNKEILNINNELLSVLKNQSIMNSIRNINLLQYTIYIDDVLKKNNIERCWLKGVRDIYSTPSLLKKRQMTDIDIIVKETEKTRNILLNEGLVHGGYDYSGNWITMNKQEIENYERNHYELFPLSKIISLYSIPDIDTYYLNKSKIYKDKDGYFTDIIFDVHRELTFDLQPDWIFKEEAFLPVMDEIDDLWYMINKCYYEIIQGDSINIQSLILTISKLKNTKVEINNIQSTVIKTGFYNEDAFSIMYELSNADSHNKVLNDVVENLANKAEEILANPN